MPALNREGRARVKIGDMEIGERTLIIAEVGSNHCGDPDLARRTLLAAAESGADAVKFQMYDPDTLVDPTMPVLRYIAQTHKTQRERFRSLALPRETFLELADLARRAGVLFLVTPFDERAVDFLDPLVPAFKIASGDLTHVRLLDRVAGTGKPVLLSTGFATVDEIDWAATRIPRERLCLLHCVGAYPTPDEEVSLDTIRFLRERYGVPVGWSDHCRGSVAAVAAVGLGAQVVEKHFLLSRDLPAADVELSADPAEFRAMTEAIRRVERMRGRAERRPSRSEAYFRETLRRAVYAHRDIQAGEPVTAEMLIALRPCGTGMVPAGEINVLVGRTLRRTVARETPIYRTDLCE
jgi:sialic acid synthase SpsE